MISIKSIVSLAVLTFLTFSLCSCAGVTPLTAERPGEEAFRTVLTKELSALNIPFEASADDLARLLDRAVRRELFKGSAGTGGLTATATRNGAMTITAADDFLFITLPVSLTLSYAIFEAPAIPLKLKFRIRVTVTPDWKMHADVRYTGLSDLLADEIRVGPLSFKPGNIVEGMIQPLQKMLSGLAEQKINEAFQLKEQAAGVWATAQSPVQLDRTHNIWLVLTPQTVMMYPVTCRNNRVKTGVGITTYAEIVAGQQPEAPKALPLPPLAVTAAFDRTFRVALNADLFYKELKNIAMTRLFNRSVDSEGRKVSVRDMDLYGNGDRLVVRLETAGDLEGTFYLTARPVFDPQTNLFSVEDVDFDLQTRNLLHRSADWFLHSAVRSMLRERINMDLTKRLEQARLAAGKALAEVRLADRLFLKGTVRNLAVHDVIVQKDRIAIRIYADGDSAVEVR